MSLPNGYKFRGKGVKWTIPKGTTKNCDYLVPDERELDRIDIFLESQGPDDTMKFQVIFNAQVVDEFADSWQVDDTSKSQGEPFGSGRFANIPGGATLRIVYDSKGAVTDPVLRVNFFLHMPPA